MHEYLCMYPSQQFSTMLLPRAKVRRCRCQKTSSHPSEKTYPTHAKNVQNAPMAMALAGAFFPPAILLPKTSTTCPLEHIASPFDLLYHFL